MGLVQNYSSKRVIKHKFLIFIFLSSTEKLFIFVSESGVGDQDNLIIIQIYFSSFWGVWVKFINLYSLSAVLDDFLFPLDHYWYRNNNQIQPSKILISQKGKSHDCFPKTHFIRKNPTMDWFPIVMDPGKFPSQIVNEEPFSVAKLNLLPKRTQFPLILKLPFFINVFFLE